MLAPTRDLSAAAATPAFVHDDDDLDAPLSYDDVDRFVANVKGKVNQTVWAKFYEVTLRLPAARVEPDVACKHIAAALASDKHYSDLLQELTALHPFYSPPSPLPGLALVGGAKDVSNTAWAAPAAAIPLAVAAIPLAVGATVKVAQFVQPSKGWGSVKADSIGVLKVFYPRILPLPSLKSLQCHDLRRYHWPLRSRVLAPRLAQVIDDASGLCLVDFPEEPAWEVPASLAPNLLATSLAAFLPLDSLHGLRLLSRRVSRLSSSASARRQLWQLRRQQTRRQRPVSRHYGRTTTLRWRWRPRRRRGVSQGATRATGPQRRSQQRRRKRLTIVKTPMR